MNRHYDLGLVRDLPLDLVGIDIVSIRIDVRVYRRGSQSGDHPGGGEKGKPAGYDLVARTYSACPHGQEQSVCAGSDPHRGFGSTVLSHFFLKLLYLRPHDELGVRQYAKDGLIQLLFYGSVLSFQIQKRNVHLILLKVSVILSNETANQLLIGRPPVSGWADY